MELSNNLPSPDDVYIHFSGRITAESYNELSATLHSFRRDLERLIHLGLYSKGGIGLYGRFLHNEIQRLRVHTYNLGEVHSAAVFAYVGGKVRYVEEGSTMFLHESRLTNPKRPQSDLVAMIERTSRLIADATGIDLELIRQMRKNETMLTAEEAVACGLAHSVRPFTVPEGAKLIRLEYPERPKSKSMAY